MARYGSIFISQDPDELSPELFPPGWLWLKKIDNGLELYEYVNSAWVLVETIPNISALSTHESNPTAHHPIPDGITGTKVIGNYRFTFTAGLLTGFEEV